jgi:hypothetical protein
MPFKVAKKSTNSQIQQAIANTQAESSQDIAQPGSSQDVAQPDAETQVDDDPSSTDNSQVIDDALASTADGAATSTADTTHTSADEAEAKPEPAAKRPAGKTVAAAADDKDGEAKKKRRRKPDYSTFSAYIFKGLPIHLIFCAAYASMLIHAILVMKQVHPDNSISQKAMQIMDDFIKGK